MEEQHMPWPQITSYSSHRMLFSGCYRIWEIFNEDILNILHFTKEESGLFFSFHLS